MLKKILGLASAATLLTASAFAQAPVTILYLNFDDAADATIAADGTAYTFGGSETVVPTVNTGNVAVDYDIDPVSAVYRNNAGDGPTIGTPVGVSGTSQGGKALLVDSGSGQDEGIMIIAGNGIAPRDITLEVIWFSSDPSGGSNTAGIQSPLGNEWPFGETAQLFLRTVGADRMDWWTDRGDSNSERVQVTGPGTIAANTWYHDVLVLDINEGDLANSQIIAYRNGTQVGTSVYNASTNSAAIFGAGFGGARRLGVGIHNSVDANLGDHRGLDGGVDAVAVTLGALVPAEFVLPSGTVHNPPSNVPNWTLY